MSAAGNKEIVRRFFEEAWNQNKAYAAHEEAQTRKSCLRLRYSAQLLKNAQPIPGGPDLGNFSIGEVKK